MTKKLLVMAVSLMMTAGLFSGCNGTSKKTDLSKEVTLRWALPYDQQEDTDMVEEKINELLSELLPNTKLELTGGDMASKWSLWMAAKETFDLAWTGYQFDMMAEYQADSYLALDDLVEQYGPNIQEEMKTFERGYASGSVNGVLYAIPNMQPILHQSSYLAIPAEWMEYFPLDEFLEECHNNAKTTERVYQLYEQYMDSLAAAGLITPGNASIDVINFFLPVATRGYDWVGTKKGGAWLCYDAFDPDAQIVSFMETAAYQLYIKYAARWYEKGYISQDYLATGSLTGTNLGVGNVTASWYNLDDERGIAYLKNDDGSVKTYQVLLDSQDNMFVGTNLFGFEKTYTVIPYTAENPERAMMLLNLLKDEKGKELLNTLVYGIEGVHYTKEQTADGDYVVHAFDYTLQPTSSSKYGIPHWVVCNVYDCYRTPNIVDGQKAWALNFETKVTDTLYKTKYYNFEVDTTDITYKIAQITAAISEYHTTLICGAKGSSGYMNTYNTMLEKMKAGLLAEVKTVVQQQADEYIAAA